MANWEVTKTKRYNKPIEEHTANTKGGAYKIEVPEGSRSGVLYRFDDLRGFERIASGDIASLKQQAESMGKKESRGVAGIERLANMSRPGAKDMMGTNKRIIRARGHEFLAEDEGNRTRISIKIDGAWEHATTVNSDNQTASEWIEANAKPGDPSRWLPSAFSRPGAKAKFKVEDRFYFGKGRKERFADDRLTKFLEVYNRNEDNNYHSENVVLLAKFLGSTDDVAQAQRIVNEHRRSSDGISEKLYKERNDLNRRLLSKFRSRYPQASI